MAGFVNDTSDAHPNAALAPGLYIVATPIGNLSDITLRAVDVLSRCDGVACEDTRVTGKLMKHLGLSKPLWRYNDHAEERDRARLIESMQTRAVALVSDAGTPLISDPGYRLVNAAREAGVEVQTIPGPCAAIAAITLAGLPSDRFLFAGFLPVKDKARDRCDAAVLRKRRAAGEIARRDRHRAARPPGGCGARADQAARGMPGGYSG